MNILVVDDEHEIANIVALYLQNDEYKVFKCYTGEEALRCIDNNAIDLAILDVMLPDIDGFEILRIIRKKYNFPVIMLTAKVDATDRITGLTLGADDYIPKPFNPLELVARVKAQLRRYRGFDSVNSEEYRGHGLVIRKREHTVAYFDREVSLTPTEFDILWLLCRNAGRVVSSKELFESVWHEVYLDSNNTIMVHIRRLREKLGEPPRKPKIIKTVWGVGYKVEK